MRLSFYGPAIIRNCSTLVLPTEGMHSLPGQILQYNQENEQNRQSRRKAFQQSLAGSAESLDETVGRYQEHRRLFNQLFEPSSSGVTKPVFLPDTTVAKLAQQAVALTAQAQAESREAERGSETADRLDSIGGAGHSDQLDGSATAESKGWHSQKNAVQL